MNLALELAARHGEGWKSGPLGFAVILVLCVACYFLFKSMSKHLKKVREEFPADGPASATPPVPPVPPAVQRAQSPVDGPNPDSPAGG